MNDAFHKLWFGKKAITMYLTVLHSCNICTKLHGAHLGVNDALHELRFAHHVCTVRHFPQHWECKSAQRENTSQLTLWASFSFRRHQIQLTTQHQSAEKQLLTAPHHQTTQHPHSLSYPVPSCCTDYRKFCFLPQHNQGLEWCHWGCGCCNHPWHFPFASSQISTLRVGPAPPDTLTQLWAKQNKTKHQQQLHTCPHCNAGNTSWNSEALEPCQFAREKKEEEKNIIRDSVFQNQFWCCSLNSQPKFYVSYSLRSRKMKLLRLPSTLLAKEINFQNVTVQLINYGPARSLSVLRMATSEDNMKNVCTAVALPNSQHAKTFSPS